MTTASTGAARHYAEAVFQVAREQHDVKGWRDDLLLVEEILGDESVAAAFGNPRLDDGRRVALAISLFGDRLKDERLNFVKLLVLNRRFDLISQVRADFDALIDEAEGRVELDVISARELPAEDREHISRMLSERTGRETRVNVRIDPRIMGGVIIRQGDRVTDGSVRRRLEELRAQLVAQ
jgi:F-type H+-transporting ATPase subunit delta